MHFSYLLHCHNRTGQLTRQNSTSLEPCPGECLLVYCVHVLNCCTVTLRVCWSNTHYLLVKQVEPILLRSIILLTSRSYHISLLRPNRNCLPELGCRYQFTGTWRFRARLLTAVIKLVIKFTSNQILLCTVQPILNIRQSIWNSVHLSLKVGFLLCVLKRIENELNKWKIYHELLLLAVRTSYISLDIEARQLRELRFIHNPFTWHCACAVCLVLVELFWNVNIYRPQRSWGKVIF